MLSLLLQLAVAFLASLTYYLLLLLFLLLRLITPFSASLTYYSFLCLFDLLLLSLPLRLTTAFPVEMLTQHPLLARLRWNEPRHGLLINILH
jgi:hypothetical protein